MKKWTFLFALCFLTGLAAGHAWNARRAGAPFFSQTRGRHESARPLQSLPLARGADLERALTSALITHDLRTLRRRRLEKIAPLFSQNETGAHISHAFVLMAEAARGAKSATGEFDGALEALRKNPEATIEELRKITKVLPGEFESERQFFVQFAARLDTDERRKVEFLTEDLNRPQASLPASLITVDSLMDASGDSAVIESVLVPFLKEHPDADFRNVVLARYATKFPEREASLETELKNH